MGRHPEIALATRQKIYIACEEMSFIWDERAIPEIIRMWNEGYSLCYIAEAFERDPDEVTILIIDLVRNDRINKRQGGVYGKTT